MRDPRRAQKWTPDQQRTATALRSIWGSVLPVVAPSPLDAAIFCCGGRSSVALQLVVAEAGRERIGIVIHRPAVQLPFAHVTFHVRTCHLRTRQVRACHVRACHARDRRVFDRRPVSLPGQVSGPRHHRRRVTVKSNSVVSTSQAASRSQAARKVPSSRQAAMASFDPVVEADAAAVAGQPGLAGLRREGGEPGE
jgi:hypothetical protein